MEKPVWNEYPGLHEYYSKDEFDQYEWTDWELEVVTEESLAVMVDEYGESHNHINVGDLIVFDRTDYPADKSIIEQWFFASAENALAQIDFGRALDLFLAAEDACPQSPVTSD